MPAADKKGTAASRIAFGGLSVALCLILLSVVRLSPTADLAMLSLTSLCIAAVVIEKGVRTAVVAWFAASLLSLLFPGFQTSLPFIGLFGFYPLAKAWIESRPDVRPWAAWVLKFLVFDALLLLGGVLVLGPLSGLFPADAFLEAWRAKLWNGAPVLLLLVAAAQALFLVYDVVLGALISVYLRRIRPALSR